MEFEGLEMKIKKGNITYWKDKEMIYKQCGKCGEIKLVEEFYRRGNGRTNKCKACEKQYCKDNAEYIKERSKQRYKDNLEYYKEYNKQYHKDNAERISEYYKQWAKDNAEHKKEVNKRYYKTIRESNLQEITNMLEQIRPVFKQLNLPVYGYVYMFENIKTGHKYVGQSINPIKTRYGHEGGIIKSWIKERLKYDNQKFKEELIEEDIVVTEVLDVAFCQYHLDKLEAYYINKYDSYNNGYNNREGNHITDDGIEEFNQILSQYNIEFIDGEIKEKRLPKQA